MTVPAEYSRPACRSGRNKRVIVGVLIVLLMLLVRTGVVVAAGAMRPALAEHGARANASGATSAHDQRDGQGHKHKEGALAVAISVAGIIVVVSLIVLLGSLSVRRRMRDDTGATGRDVRGPPGRKRGFFS